MKTTGIVRKIDELGRVVLPSELRRTMDLNVRDEVEIYLEEDKIILKKYEPACIFCGGHCNLVNYRGRNICMDCIGSLNEI